ncbi:MAG: xanthine dehydrogenase family protein molybdopterin-binding subunit, partial [Thermoanaerobaculia bacterium]
MPHAVGRNIPRVDGPAKVTGQALYVDDETRPGVLRGATLRSALARGRLRSITPDPAFDWSGITLVTSEDVPVNVVMLIEEDQPVLVPIGGEIRHQYEPIALLACEDPLRLARALRHLKVEVEPIPPVLGMDASVALFDVIYGKDNVMKRFTIRKGDAESALASCEVVVRGTYDVHHQEQLYIEPQGVMAWWADGHAFLTGSLQCPFYVQKGIKKTFSLHDDVIDVTQSVTGGGFGGKEEYPTILSLHALLLARKSGHAVKMIYDRQEDIEATTKRHPARMSIASGCDRDGTLRAVTIDVLMDGGAYVTLTPVVLSRGALHAAGAYRWEHVLIEARAVATNTPPNGAFRGFGAPQTIWGMERHLDRVARELGIDPLDLKEKNVLRLGDTTATGQILRESVGVQECIDEARAASDYAAKRASLGKPLLENGARIARGIGASVFMHGAGFTGSGERRMKGRVALDLLGDGPAPRILIRSASTDIGQGTETVFRQIAASALGLPIDRIDVLNPSTARVPDSGPTVASRTVMVVGSLVENAARELCTLIEKERASGGGSFDEAAARLIERDGVLTSEKVYEPPPGLFFDEETYTGDAYPVFGWGCD